MTFLLSVANWVLETPARRALVWMVLTVSVLLPPYLVGRVPGPIVSIAIISLLLTGAVLLNRSPLAIRGPRSLFVIYLASAVAFAGTTLFDLFQYHRFIAWVDSPKFAQALWLVLQGQGLRPFFGHNPSGIHLHPSLLLLLPVYWLVPSHLTLIIGRNALVAFAAIPLFVALRRHLGDAAGLLFGLAYLSHYTILNTLTWGYHEFHLFPPSFFWRVCSSSGASSGRG